jgi:hypothetical protein
LPESADASHLAGCRRRVPGPHSCKRLADADELEKEAPEPAGQEPARRLGGPDAPPTPC